MGEAEQQPPRGSRVLTSYGQGDGVLTLTCDSPQEAEARSAGGPLDCSADGPWTDDSPECSSDPSELYGKFTWKIENFDSITKRELRSSVFEVGSYKWYILVYPNGCDVCNHLSLFLCVADYDKLLPGWSHFAQFTIAVVNRDPKKSKYSDTLHRFCKKEHDWGWKKFMELGKVHDGFTVANTLVIKAQVQVIQEKNHRPFRCLDSQYRRELVRVYLSNVEGICRRSMEERREQLQQLYEELSSFQSFWQSISDSMRERLAHDRSDIVMRDLVKRFFNEKEVTSTLVMDALYCGARQLDCGADSDPACSTAINGIVGFNVARNRCCLRVNAVDALDEMVQGLRLEPSDAPSEKEKDKDKEVEESTKDSVDKDERRLAELGKKAVEMFAASHLFFSRIEQAYREALALKRQEALIKEEEEAESAKSNGQNKRKARARGKRSHHKPNQQKATQAQQTQQSLQHAQQHAEQERILSDAAGTEYTGSENKSQDQQSEEVVGTQSTRDDEEYAVGFQEADGTQRFYSGSASADAAVPVSTVMAAGVDVYDSDTATSKSTSAEAENARASNTSASSTAPRYEYNGSDRAETSTPEQNGYIAMKRESAAGSSTTERHNGDSKLGGEANEKHAEDAKPQQQPEQHYRRGGRRSRRSKDRKQCEEKDERSDAERGTNTAYVAFAATSTPETRERDMPIPERARQRISSLETRVHELESQLEKKDSELNAFQQEVNSLKADISSKQKTLSAKDREISKLKKALAEAQQQPTPFSAAASGSLASGLHQSQHHGGADVTGKPTANGSPALYYHAAMDAAGNGAHGAGFGSTGSSGAASAAASGATLHPTHSNGNVPPNALSVGADSSYRAAASQKARAAAQGFPPAPAEERSPASGPGPTAAAAAALSAAHGSGNMQQPGPDVQQHASPQVHASTGADMMQQHSEFEDLEGDKPFLNNIESLLGE